MGSARRPVSARQPAIVVSDGPQGLAVTRSLGERGVPVVVLHSDDRDFSRHSRYATHSVRVPRPELDGEAFTQALFGLRDRWGGAVLIPTSDAAVKDIARAKTALAQHFRVACPDWEVAARFIDKRYTYEIASQLGIAIPRTFAPDVGEDLEAFSRDALYPCLVKPRQSHLYSRLFQRKLTVVSDLRQMRVAIHEAQDAGLDVLVQELIPGPDHHGVNYNAYRTREGVVADCTARKIRQFPSGSGLPCVVESVPVPPIVAPGRALLKGVGLEGFACVEFKFDDRDGVYKLLEINGRHNLSSLLSIRAGVDFPWIDYRYAIAGDIPPTPKVRSGLYWIDELHDPSRLARHRREAASLRDMLLPWRREHVFAVSDRRDPAPLREVSRRLLGRLLRRARP